MRAVAVLFAIGVAWGAWNWWSSEREVAHRPGVTAPDEPRQRNLDPPLRVAVREYALEKRARFDLRVRVLARENYRFDGGAALAPVDLAVGWGPMSDSSVLERLSLSQMGRFFYWAPKDGRSWPIPRDQLETHAAQLHVIPASPSLERKYRHLRPGQLVTIGGWLVDVTGPGGFSWRTSMRRDDTGAGACEIVLAETLSVE
jgi:hypothetical protein